MDKMFSKKINFGGFKETMQNAQQEFSTGWKSMTEKAKKEAKIANKKARKLMELEDGGDLRHEYILSVNLSAGHDVFKKFQENWVTMHEESIKNVKKCDYVDNMINSFAKDYYTSRDLLDEFQGNLLTLPDVLSRVEIAQSRIDAIGKLVRHSTEFQYAIGKSVRHIESLLYEYEDACEKVELENQKEELKVKLSQLVETKHAEYTLKKQIVEGSNKQQRSSQMRADETTRVVAATASPPHAALQSGANKKKYEREKSLEKQKAYQDAFLEQMNEYIRSGEVEKPIAGSAGFTVDESEADVDIEIGESDFSALSEFLGPEEMNSVLQASASQQSTRLLRASTSSASSSTDNIPIKVTDTSSSTDNVPTDIAEISSSADNLPSKVSDTISSSDNLPTPVADSTVSSKDDAKTEVDETIKTLNPTVAIEEKSDNENNDREVTEDIEPSLEDVNEKTSLAANSDEEFFDADE